MLQPLWKIVQLFLNKLNKQVPYDPAIPCLGLYPKELKTSVKTNICLQTFTAAISTKVRKWKQPKCPSTDAQINKIKYSHTMGYYSTVKRRKY